MTLNEALSLYNIPYIITETITGGGFTSYRMTPAGSSATPERLKSKLNAINSATGSKYEIVDTSNGVILRSRTGSPIYNYFDYNGYIDYEDSKIPFIVGFNQSGIILDNLDAARHMLIAGTTGSGKSVFLHDLIISFCCNRNCDVFLVDCKKVEFSFYNSCALVTSEVFGENSAAIYTNHLIQTMETRFGEMAAAGVNDFETWKRLHPEAKRQILVIDELSDLISNKDAKRIIIPRLLRLAQKGRAAGVHVILATQRPDSTIINGTLKGNIPTRIAFKTISRIDSQIILDRTGAETLAGNGDGLYMRSNGSTLERVQAPFIKTDDIRKLTKKTA